MSGVLPARVLRRWTAFLLLAALPLLAIRLGGRAADKPSPAWMVHLLGGAGLLLATLGGLAALLAGSVVAIRTRSFPTLAIALAFGTAGACLAWLYLRQLPW